MTTANYPPRQFEDDAQVIDPTGTVGTIGYGQCHDGEWLYRVIYPTPWASSRQPRRLAWAEHELTAAG